MLSRKIRHTKDSPTNGRVFIGDYPVSRIGLNMLSIAESRRKVERQGDPRYTAVEPSDPQSV
jgi:hypothetical protein